MNRLRCRETQRYKIQIYVYIYTSVYAHACVRVKVRGCEGARVSMELYSCGTLSDRWVKLIIVHCLMIARTDVEGRLQSSDFAI
jgi:hypothetical protein